MFVLYPTSIAQDTCHMPRKKHTKESIIQKLQNLSQHLGKAKLSKADVQQVIPVSSVSRLFGSLGNALEAAGLDRTIAFEHFKGRGNIISDDDLFQSLLVLENKLGREPHYYDNTAKGKYSSNPFRKRFGKWPDVLARYRKWKADRSAISADKYDSFNQIKETMEILPEMREDAIKLTLSVDETTPKHFYGEPINFRGLRHAPINEQGVVYLFGMVSRELGFYIEALQQGFPDCEGKYLHNKKRNLWAKARIEFEYKASHFREHGHDPNQCDFIVCWINDWPECPIKVIELKTRILGLSPK